MEEVGELKLKMEEVAELKLRMEKEKNSIDFENCDNKGKKENIPNPPVDDAENSEGLHKIQQLSHNVNALQIGLHRLEDDLRRRLVPQQETQLSAIQKQRRTWEGTREKAEQMSQIYDSLIITNDRPYLSCGIDSGLTSAGMVVFNQFELINKIDWCEEEGFCLVEPGVYLLQVSGTLHCCSTLVKLVSHQLEAELVSLVCAPSSTFRSRSTIFTVEDDDREAEKIVVEVLTQDGEPVVEDDFSLLIYKISEVSTSEGGADSWRVVDD